MAAEHIHRANTIEKDWHASDGDHNGSSQHLHGDMSPSEELKRIQTAGSISISPELFEKLYLSPQNQVKGELRRTVANPTPVALIGFLIALTPLSMDLMDWRGTGGPGVGAAGIGSYYFSGGLLMLLGALGEFLVGNTFPCVVFASFGAYWLTFAATLQPYFNASGAYATDPGNLATGASSPEFLNSYAYFLIAVGIMCFLYMILSLRTNVVFFLIFFSLVLAFGFLAGSNFQAALGNLALSRRLQVAGGACCLIVSAAGWWIFFAIMLAAMDFPFQIPVGDLSTVIKGASERKNLMVSNV